MGPNEPASEARIVPRLSSHQCPLMRGDVFPRSSCFPAAALISGLVHTLDTLVLFLPGISCRVLVGQGTSFLLQRPKPLDVCCPASWEPGRPPSCGPGLSKHLFTLEAVSLGPARQGSRGHGLTR